MFGIFGYLAVALAAGTVLLWLVQWRRPTRIIARSAMLLALLAFAGARINSSTHVNRIKIDPAEHQAVAKAREEQRRQAALENRGEEVADIRFAEDAEGEFYDRAGMDEADLKYLEGGDSEAPGWKEQKRERGREDTADDSLEGMIGAKDKSEGVETDEVTNERKPLILMSSGDLAIANRLDRWNIDFTLALLLVSLLVLAHDYLRRSNIYQEASLPLPLPSGLRNAVTPIPAVVERPEPPRRSVPDELAWLIRRGEAFLYFTADPAAADEVMSRLEPLAGKSRRLDVIRVSRDGPPVSDEFVFDALWFNRASFVVDSAARAERMLDRFHELLHERRAIRARVRQAVHVVWDLKSPLPAATRDAIARLAGATGFSMFLCERP
jgi:hypothetical protein